jgi:hypothetical protein
MLDPNVQLATFTHAGGGHTQHQNATRSLTADGKRVVDWANSLPPEQGAAVVKAFNAQGIRPQDFAGNFNEWQGGGSPARYDPHTGKYYGADGQGVVICTDESLLVAKHHK